jgi:hypothetical protein
MTTMLLQPYRFRVKTAPETFTQQQISTKDEKFNSNNLLLYFKGEQGLTQTLVLPLNKMTDDIYDSTLELLDVGNVNRANTIII